MKEISVAEYLAKFFYENDIKYIFFIPVIGVKLLKALEKYKIRKIIPHSEKAAAYMADGYARIRNKPAVCMSQSVGSFNLASGLQDAYLASSPVLAITGRRPQHELLRNAYQEIDHTNLFSVVTKYSTYMNSPDFVPSTINNAFRVSTSNCPGPVHLDIPGFTGHGLNKMVFTDSGKNYNSYSIPFKRTNPSTIDIEKFFKLLKKAKYPLFIAGGGTLKSNSGEILQKVIEKYRIPLISTNNGKGVINEDHDLYFGVVGQYSRDSANLILSNSDFLVYLGSKTGSLTTNEWTVPPLDTEIVQVDIEPSEIGKNYPLHLGIVSDLKNFLNVVYDFNNKIYSSKKWLKKCSSYREQWLQKYRPLLTSNNIPIRPERLCYELTKVLPSNGILVSDTGHAGIWSSAMFEIRQKTQKYIRCSGSLGWAFPASIGVKCACPKNTVICFTGDGGFWYHLVEFETAVKYNINIVTVINNNHSFNQEKEVNERMFGKKTSSSDELWILPETNFAEMARTMGGIGFSVTEPKDINKVILEAINSNKPVIVDVKTDIDAIAEPPIVPTKINKKFSFSNSTL